MSPSRSLTPTSEDGLDATVARLREAGVEFLIGKASERPCSGATSTVGTGHAPEPMITALETSDDRVGIVLAAGHATCIHADVPDDHTVLSLSTIEAHSLQCMAER